jgi:NAD(P)H dehydrogenase (quinone)
MVLLPSVGAGGSRRAPTSSRHERRRKRESLPVGVLGVPRSSVDAESSAREYRRHHQVGITRIGIDLAEGRDMTQPPTIAVTGATGFVGGAVARDLASRGIRQRLLVRAPDRAPDLPGATVHRAPYDDPEAALAALQGVETLLMVSATETEDRVAQHLAFVEAAERAGVQHIVYTSLLSAAPDAVFTLARDHWSTEQRIRQSGMAWTMLRDSLYLDFLPLLAGETGELRGPAADGRVSVVSRADVARSAAAVLVEPSAHAGRTYVLTGPEALSFDEIAAVLSRATGRPFTFHDETVDEAYASRAAYGAPAWQLDAWVSTYTAIAGGAVAAVSGDVEALTGRPPQSLEAFLGEQAPEQ